VRLAESAVWVYSTATRDIGRLGLDIDVRKHSDNGVHVIHLRGDLKLGEPVDGLRQACLDLMNEGDNRLVVNLTEVPMIDSSGIGVLVRTLTQAKQHGGALKLVNPSKFALQTLKIVGLLSLFELFPDDTQAIQSFN
jgi:anti-sigma B factor antagonist